LALRVPWQELYFMSYQTGTIGVTQTFIAGSMGITTSEFAIPLINHPDLNPGQEIIDQRKAIGRSQRSVGTGHCEFLQGTKMPNTTWEFDGNAYNLAPFLWALFQGGSSEGTGTAKFTKTFDPPTATEGPACEVWMNLGRLMEAGTSAHSTKIYGAICRSITLSAEGYSPLKVSAEMVGAGIGNVYDGEPWVHTMDSNCGLVWGGTSGATCELGTSAVELEGFTMTITNNAIPRHYGSNTVQKFITGDITVEGSITVFWGDTNHGQEAEITDFIAGTDNLLEIYWGSKSGTSAGDLDLKVNARYTGATVVAEDEIGIELPFIGVYDGTNDAVDIVLADGIDRGI